MRLIDADVVKPKIKEIIMFAPNVLMNLELAIDNAPTIDTAAHGEWIYEGCDYKCSICGHWKGNYFGAEGNTNYCPNCGAKMDGGI